MHREKIITKEHNVASKRLYAHRISTNKKTPTLCILVLFLETRKSKHKAGNARIYGRINNSILKRKIICTQRILFTKVHIVASKRFERILLRNLEYQKDKKTQDMYFSVIFGNPEISC